MPALLLMKSSSKDLQFCYFVNSANLLISSPLSIMLLEIRFVARPLLEILGGGDLTHSTPLAIDLVFILTPNARNVP